MFRERIANWGKILDLLPTTINGIVVLAKLKIPSLPARADQSWIPSTRIDNDPRREIAIAYSQMSRFNR